MPRMPRQPRSVPLHPRYTPEWPGRAYHYDHPMSTNDELEMLRTLKRDMPKEYQALTDADYRSSTSPRSLEGLPLTVRASDALDKIDLHATQAGRPPFHLADDLLDSYSGSIRLMSAINKAATRGILPAALAARYAVSDQTKTTPRAAKKTTRKKK